MWSATVTENTYIRLIALYGRVRGQVYECWVGCGFGEKTVTNVAAAAKVWQEPDAAYRCFAGSGFAEPFGAG